MTQAATTTILLIRHTAHELGPGVLPGRTPGVHLSPRGREHAAELASRLADLPITAIYASPLERAVETAQPLSTLRALPTRIAEGLTEIDYGDWSGRALAALADDPAWHAWNSRRSTIRPPRGELMLEAQARALAELTRLTARHPGEHIAVYTHADIIRALVAHLLAIPLDLMLRLEIDLGSVTVVRQYETSHAVVCLNHTGPLR